MEAPLGQVKRLTGHNVRATGAAEDFTTINYDISNTEHHRTVLHKYGAI